METRNVLIVGSILLCSGCIGLLIVRLTNPFFKGLGWLGGSFAAGALGAAVIALSDVVSSDFLILIADTLILLAYVFLHAGILEITESESHFPRLGIVLLVIQIAAFPVFLYLHDAGPLCAITLGFLLAVQALQSAALLKRKVSAGMGAPIWFSFTLLVAFATFNLSRSALILTLEILKRPPFPEPLEVITAIVFFGTGLGLGFGAFWITSAQIRLKLEQLASIDPLTGIYNRRSFIALCEQELLRSVRAGEVFSVIMFDVDHFKKINDRHGHATGDVVLCAVVEKLRNSVRNIDIVGRWGGEEFVALLPKADADAALIVAQRLRYHIDLISIVHRHLREIDGEKAITVTISTGVATYLGQTGALDINDLLHQCDTAMYRAKTEGRNRIVSVDAQYALPL
jgi:diguanylate cyclase (GGDEF)-like protein